MDFLSWNCPRLGNSRKVRILGDLIKSRKPNFLFLLKTLVCSNRVEELCYKFGFIHYFAVDKIGRGGGLAVMWKRNIDVLVIDSSLNQIDVNILEIKVALWRLTYFFWFPRTFS